MMMVNGFGAVLGAYISGFVVDYYTANNGIKDWASIWFICAVYALIIGVLFALVFRYKHTGEENLVIKK